MVARAADPTPPATPATLPRRRHTTPGLEVLHERFIRCSRRRFLGHGQVSELALRNRNARTRHL